MTSAPKIHQRIRMLPFPLWVLSTLWSTWSSSSSSSLTSSDRLIVMMIPVKNKWEAEDAPLSVLCARHSLRQRRQSVPRRREVDIASPTHTPLKNQSTRGWISGDKRPVAGPQVAERQTDSWWTDGECSERLLALRGRPAGWEAAITGWFSGDFEEQAVWAVSLYLMTICVRN